MELVTIMVRTVGYRCQHMRMDRKSAGRRSGEEAGSGRTRSFIVVCVEPAGEPGEESHLDNEDDGMQQRLEVEAFLLVDAAGPAVDRGCGRFGDGDIGWKGVKWQALTIRP
jgi:hypothetical protein